MKHYFFQSRRQGRKTVLAVLPDQKSHDGLPLRDPCVIDADGTSARYPEGTFFSSTSLVTRHKGHGYWLEARGVKVLSAPPELLTDSPDGAMLRKWERYLASHRKEQ